MKEDSKRGKGETERQRDTKKGKLKQVGLKKFPRAFGK